MKSREIVWVMGDDAFPGFRLEGVWKKEVLQVLPLNSTRSGVESAYIVRLLNVSLVHHASAFLFEPIC